MFVEEGCSYGDVKVLPGQVRQGSKGVAIQNSRPNLPKLAASKAIRSYRAVGLCKGFANFFPVPWNLNLPVPCSSCSSHWIKLSMRRNTHPLRLPFPSHPSFRIHGWEGHQVIHTVAVHQLFTQCCHPFIPRISSPACHTVDAAGGHGTHGLTYHTEMGTFNKGIPLLRLGMGWEWGFWWLWAGLMVLQ